jgi:hypothetical protein
MNDTGMGCKGALKLYHRRFIAERGRLPPDSCRTFALRGHILLQSIGGSW